MEKTKLIATVCTNKNAKGQIDKFIEYGIDVIRINMSYTTREETKELMDIIEKANKKHNTHVATMLDLEGPCIRTGEFIGGKATLNTGDKIRIYMNDIKGTMAGFSVNYKELINDLKYKTIIKLSKGNVELEVIEKSLDYALCKVI